MIPIGMFAGLIWDIKMIKVVRGGRRLGWAGTVNDEDEALRRIFRGVRGEENEAFLRSNDWQRQIDVLLAEVLRKRPGFVTRIFGGGLYWLFCVLPILLIVGLCALLVVGLGSLGRYEIDSDPFVKDFPAQQRTITGAQNAAIETLISATPESAADPAQTAKLGTLLDKLDWTAAHIVHRSDGIDPAILAVWLDVLCGKLETATREGRQSEAARRAELLLHGLGAMEPALTLAHREVLWNAELRTLAEVEKLSATGKIDAVTLQRIESRVNALNKAPLPEVDNLLLVGGWGAAQAGRVAKITLRDEDSGPLISDARFWRHVYPEVRRLSETGFSTDGGTPATVALARHWKKTRQVGALPAKLDEPVSASPEEAGFIIAFCENHRRARWWRSTTLSALQFEAYRRKTGGFPPVWKDSLPDGATLELIHQPAAVVLQLTDIRGQQEPALPAWLGTGKKVSPAIDHTCPLYVGKSQ